MRARASRWGACGSVWERVRGIWRAASERAGRCGELRRKERRREERSHQLNKFAVLPHHFLLCPVVEAPQSLPPTPDQLAHAYSFLQAASRERKDLLAFYNGGPGAGASQRWRHIQFVEARAPVTEWVRSMVFERQGECGCE